MVLAGIVLLAMKGYLGSIEAGGRLETSVESPLRPDAVAVSLSSGILQDLFGARSWGPEDRILLMVLGTEVCGASLVEAEDWAERALQLSGEGRIHPVGLVLNESVATAERFATVAELSFQTLSSADPALRESFGFSLNRLSRQLVVLLDPTSGAVLDSRYLSNGLTSPVAKDQFLYAQG